MGKVVIPAGFDMAGDFSDGMAIVRKYGKWGVISTLGTEIHKCAYDSIAPFSDGIALAIAEGKQYYLYSDGKAQELPSDKMFYSFHNGLAKVKKQYGGKERYGYIDSEGFFVIDPIFEEAGDFFGENALVTHRGKLFSIDKKGRKTSQKFIFTPENTTFSGEAGSGFMKQGDRYIFVRNDHGNYTPMPFSFSKVSTFKEGYALVTTTAGKLQYIRPNGTVAIELPENCTAAGDFSEGLAWICLGDKYGFIDNLGRIIIDTVFSYTSNFNNGLAYVVFDGRQGIIRRASDNETYPDMSIERVAVVDADGNGKVEPGESFQLYASLENKGNDAVKNISVSITGQAGQSSWFTYQTNQQTIDLLEPDETITLIFNGKAATDMGTDNIVVNFKAIADNQLLTAGNSLTFLAAGTSNTNNAFPAHMAQSSQRQDTSQSATAGKSELLAGLMAVKNPDNNKYALIIGNEDYNKFKQQALYEPNVDFAVSDAEVFGEYARKILGVPESNIILLKNATYSQMNSSINKIARMAGLNPGKIDLYVYYAGHGQVDGNSKDCYLIPVDVSTTSPSDGIKLETMYAKLSESGARRTMVFLDACYSGIGRGIVIRPKDTPIKGNLVVMTASSAIQRSMPYAEKRHGLFTYFLLKQLKDSSGDITIENLYESVRASVQSNSIWINNMEQTPELLSGPGISEGWKQWKP